MENTNQPSWPMSWREKMDRMKVNEDIPVEEKLVKSVRYIAFKHFHSKSANSVKRFTTKKIKNTNPPEYKLWRKEDAKKEVNHVRDN